MTVWESLLTFPGAVGRAGARYNGWALEIRQVGRPDKIHLIYHDGPYFKV